MDFDDTPQEAAFRAEARAFLDANATRKSSGEPAQRARIDPDAARAWQAKRAEGGFGAILLPTEFGGRGGTPIEQVIYDQEEQKYHIPPGRVFMVTFGMCIPTMIGFATPEQLACHVPAAIKGDEIWCQLFSEPAGGSDLAGIRTRAERQGNGWVVNGQKVWTSGAHFSDFGLLLARTDPDVPKHAGLTAFFIDMKSPGIEIRPIRQIDGSAHFNEVFFNDVFIPDSQRLGEPGQGWKVALFTLSNEKVAVGTVDGPSFEELVGILQTLEIDGAPPVASPAIRKRLVDWYCINEAQKYTTLRVLTALSQGKAPGAEASILKLVGAGQLLESASETLDWMGPAGVATTEDLTPLGGYLQRLFLYAPGERIGGGTEEIMLNLIAERALHLPGDIRTDKNIPFSQIDTAGR